MTGVEILNFDDFFRHTAASSIAPYHDNLRELISRQFLERLHGEFRQWHSSLDKLPDLTAADMDFGNDSIVIGKAEQIDHGQRQALQDHLQMLHPWRKGPWNLFGIRIDAEWRSNLKWERLLPHISPLTGRMVLDAGCGNGYYMFRMQAQKPEFVLGIDPSQLCLLQFRTFKKYLPVLPLDCLPLKDRHLPLPMPVFDTVFSMGVLYHHRDPLSHLHYMRECLKTSGELVLESLVIEGGPGDVLRPAQRYAKMANVHAIPSCECLAGWLTAAGFADIHLADKTMTTTEEQRSTEWMRFQSLQDFLDPVNPARTVEGYPAPVRAIVICRKK